MDEESTGGMVILPGITTSWTRNPPKEWLFCRESPAHGQGIPMKNVYSVGNYPFKDEESTGGKGFRRNCQLIDEESTRGKKIPPRTDSSFTWIQTGKIKMRGKSSEGNNFRLSSFKSSLMPMTCSGLLLGTTYLSN
jgi:hypothetical protein